MANKRDPRAADLQAGADEAIARVLEAERDAQQALARCETGAAALVASAGERAARVRNAAERRIRVLRAKISAAAERRIGELERDGEPAARASAQDPAQDERLRRAAAAFVRELISARQ